LSRIKEENKKKIHLNILSSLDYDWGKVSNLGISYSISKHTGRENYLGKINEAVNSNCEYSVKLDEDCFINEHVWDYMIENVEQLKGDVLAIAPVMSNNIPSCDLFIEDFIKDESVKAEIYSDFLNRSMPLGLWGVDYSSLDVCTVWSKKWDYKTYYEELDKIPTLIKGMHPLRICYHAQMLVNKYITENLGTFLEQGSYSLVEIPAPYFTNSFFLIKTEDWKNIFGNRVVDNYDEITLNNYKNKNNKKILFVKNGFGIHLMFNTVHGNKNEWGIGGENGEQDEKDFFQTLNNKVHDTLHWR
jgi:hypothetical protein